MAGDHGGPRGSGYGLGLSTRTQVTGYQFLARRTAMALTRWRVRMEIEPGRRQTLAVVASVSAALVICLGALLYSFISPSGQLNDTPIIADRDSGALYVRVGDKLYPALNLASARLIAGRPDNPHKVRGSQIAQQPHGPLVGIPGAPSEFSPTTPATASWLVCDSVAQKAGVGAPSPVTVTVIDGTPDLSGRRHVVNGSDAVVLRYEKDTYVIRQGRRSRIDSMNRAVLLPLGLTPENVSQARPMSRALFDALAGRPRAVGAQGAECRQAGGIRRRARTGGNRDRDTANQWATTVFSGAGGWCADRDTGGGSDPAERRYLGGQFTGGGVTGVVGEDACGQRAGSVVLPRRSAEPGGPPGEPGDVLVVGEDGRRGACARSGDLRPDHPGQRAVAPSKLCRWSRRTRPAAKPTASTSARTMATGWSSPATIRARVHPNRSGGFRVPVCDSAWRILVMLAQHWG
jgi:hypothetical protein